MSKAPEVKRNFVKKGTVVIVKQTIEDVELKPMDICNNLDQMRNNIHKAEDQLNQTKNQEEQILKSIEEMKQNMKDIDKFETWAVEVQESKLKNYVKECLEECKNKVNETYSMDETLGSDEKSNLEANNRQKYALLQKQVSANKPIAENISRNIIMKKLFVDSIIPNPYA